MSTLRVAAVQHAPAWQDRDATLAALTPTVAVAASTGARLVVLPELFATGFSMATDVIGEPEDGPTVGVAARPRRRPRRLARRIGARAPRR
jgi:predicted amidohydrolase